MMRRAWLMSLAVLVLGVSLVGVPAGRASAVTAQVPPGVPTGPIELDGKFGAVCNTAITRAVHVSLNRYDLDTRWVMRCFVDPVMVEGYTPVSANLELRDANRWDPVPNFDSEIVQWNRETGEMIAIAKNLVVGSSGYRWLQGGRVAPIFKFVNPSEPSDSVEVLTRPGHRAGEGWTESYNNIWSETTEAVPYWPPWPVAWPINAKPPASKDFKGLPAVRCSVDLWRTQGTEIRGDFLAAAANKELGHVATDSWEWAFEWEQPSGPDRRNPYDPAFWEDAVTWEGPVQRSVSVPHELTPPGGVEVPSGGWWAVVRLRRSYRVPVETELTTQGVEEVTWRKELQMAVPSAGWWPFAGWFANAQPEDYTTYRFTDSVSVVNGVVEWEEVSVPCGVVVDPDRADRGAVVTEIRPDSGSTPTPAAGLGDGSAGDCDRPSGWGWLNPISTIGYGLCELGGAFDGAGLLGDLAGLFGKLLDALVDLLNGVLGLVGGIIGGISDLFIPSSLDFGWSELRQSAEGRAPYAYAVAAKDSVQSVLDGVGGASGSCPRMAIPKYGVSECIEGPKASWGGVSAFRAVVVVSLWVGVFWRIARTAPWARGRDGGEPGGD